MKMNSKLRRILLTVCSAALLVCVTVGATVAYLTSTETVTNTFTVGKVDITLDEAAIKQDIEAVTSNLRFYLVLLLNQIICYFSKADREMVLSINDFFHEYENSMDVIEKTPSREYLLSYEYEHNLIK